MYKEFEITYEYVLGKMCLPHNESASIVVLGTWLNLKSFVSHTIDPAVTVNNIMIY